MIVEVHCAVLKEADGERLPIDLSGLLNECLSVFLLEDVVGSVEFLLRRGLGGSRLARYFRHFDLF